MLLSIFTEKDLGFLRIGSLNVRVKKTTEAFSNFLGVGSTQTRVPMTTYSRSSIPASQQAYFEKVHKTWGSADNIPQVSHFLYKLKQNKHIHVTLES